MFWCRLLLCTPFLNGIFTPIVFFDSFLIGDLSVLTQQSEANLEVFLQDDIRDEVVRFKASKDVFALTNQRDTAMSVAFWIRPENIDKQEVMSGLSGKPNY